MILKSTALATSLTKSITPVYLITGVEPYLNNEAALAIKNKFRNIDEPPDEKIMELNTPNDWESLIQEANSYSLFATRTLIDARLEKKSLDQITKKYLLTYLNNVNTNCLILIRAPNLANKPITTISTHKNLSHIYTYALIGNEQIQFIQKKLQEYGFSFEQNVPTILHQLTQNNLSACVQAIEKIAITHDKNSHLTVAGVMPHLNDTAHFSLYTLTDACLAKQTEKALYLLRKLKQDRVEPTLLLWGLTDMTRTLIELLHLMQHHSMSAIDACSEKKIWPQKIQIYTKILQNLSVNKLYSILRQAEHLDECLKSNNSSTIWQQFENIIVSFTTEAYKSQEFANTRNIALP